MYHRKGKCVFWLSIIWYGFRTLIELLTPELKFANFLDCNLKVFREGLQVHS